MAARVQLDGGSYQYGGVTATSGQVARFSYDATSGIKTAEWRLSYTAGFALPSGWTDLGGGVYGYDGLTPPTITLNSLGKWLLTLILKRNDGSQSVDKTLALRVLNDTFEFLCHGEENQFGGWIAVLNRDIDAARLNGGEGGGGVDVPSTDNLLPFSASSSLSWSTQVFSNGAWVGFGTTSGALPNSGAVRLAQNATVTVRTNSGGAADVLLVSGTNFYLGSNSISHQYLRATQDHTFQVNASQRFAIGSDYYAFGPTDSLPTAGTWRTPTGFSWRGYSSGAGALLVGWDGSTRELSIGAYAADSTDVNTVQCAAEDGWFWTINNVASLQVTSDGIATNGQPIILAANAASSGNIRAAGGFGIWGRYNATDVVVVSFSDLGFVTLGSYAVPLAVVAAKDQIELDVNNNAVAIIDENKWNLLGKDLTNFRSYGTETDAVVAAEGAANNDYTFVATAGQAISIEVQVRIWGATAATFTTVRATVDILRRTSDAVIQEDPPVQTVSGTLPSGVTVVFTCPSANVLRTQVANDDNANAYRCSVRAWNQPAETLSLPS